jgi:hypothetical protein
MSVLGTIAAGAYIGLDSILIRPHRGFENIKTDSGETLEDLFADAVVEEKSIDQLDITDHPIEEGATISDHAYKLPSQVTLILGFSNSPNKNNNLLDAAIGALATTGSIARNLTSGALALGTVVSFFNGASVDQVKYNYDRLLEMQSRRALFTLYTGKRKYDNMIIKGITNLTNSKTENSMLITVECHQLILVNTSVLTFKKDVQATPGATASQVDKGIKQVVP